MSSGVRRPLDHRPGHSTHGGKDERGGVRSEWSRARGDFRRGDALRVGRREYDRTRVGWRRRVSTQERTLDGEGSSGGSVLCVYYWSVWDPETGVGPKRGVGKGTQVRVPRERPVVSRIGGTPFSRGGMGVYFTRSRGPVPLPVTTRNSNRSCPGS